jgi:hypothetical protein
MSLIIEERTRGVRFRVKVQARARREEIVGVHDGRLRLRVLAPPIDGRANQAVVALLAECLHVPRALVKITAGQLASLKVVEVAGLTAATVLERLQLGPAHSGSSAGESE